MATPWSRRLVPAFVEIAPNLVYKRMFKSGHQPLLFFLGQVGMGQTKSVVLQKVESLVAPALAQETMELVDLEYVHEHGQWVLRLFLDKPGGITLDDCARMSERLGGILDAADPIPQSYSLEISSPGINRPLRKDADYDRFRGEKVEISMYAPVNGRRHFKGVLQGLEQGKVVVEESPEVRFMLPLADIAKARLDPDMTF